MELTLEQEMELVKKHKDELICSSCQHELVNKDYKINKFHLFFGLFCIIIGIIIGYFIF